MGIVGRKCDEYASDKTLPAVLCALTRAAVMGGLEPLSVVRAYEIVLIHATLRDEAAIGAEVTADVHDQLSSDGMSSAMATSAVHGALRAVPAACDEECL